MKKILFGILIFSASNIFAQYPKTSISNGLIEANLYLPDDKNGFYTGTRFDWAGVINSLKFKRLMKNVCVIVARKMLQCPFDSFW